MGGVDLKPKKREIEREKKKKKKGPRSIFHWLEMNFLQLMCVHLFSIFLKFLVKFAKEQGSLSLSLLPSKGGAEGEGINNLSVTNKKISSPFNSFYAVSTLRH